MHAPGPAVAGANGPSAVWLAGLPGWSATRRGLAKSLWITVGAVEKHIRHIFGGLEIPASPDIHRRVPVVITYLGTR